PRWLGPEANPGHSQSGLEAGKAGQELHRGLPGKCVRGCGQGSVGGGKEVRRKRAQIGRVAICNFVDFLLVISHLHEIRNGPLARAVCFSGGAYSPVVTWPKRASNSSKSAK